MSKPRALNTRHQRRRSPEDGKTRVFISWAGDVGQRLAEGLKDTIFKYPGVSAFVSSVDIAAGAPWLAELEQGLRESAFAVACLTPGSTRQPWLNFEGGFAFAVRGNFKLIRFGEDPQPPLNNLQSIDGFSVTELAKLLKDIVKDEHGVDAWLAGIWHQWSKLLEREKDALVRPDNDVVRSANQLADLAAALAKSPSVLRDNGFLQHLINLSLKELSDRLIARKLHYSIPASLYPHRLIDLQKNLKAHVSAIALIAEEEAFWQQTLGDQILRTALPNSSRIFVFAKRREFEQHFDTLIQHATAYNVYALHLDVLTRQFPGYRKDFSVISMERESVVAYYGEHDDRMNIKFSGDVNEISLHTETFRRIRDSSIPIDKTMRRENADTVLSLWDRIERPTRIKPELSRYEERMIEMSKYISIDDYDAHEEEHAYYVEMMETMLASLERLYPERNRPIRILELGAGTGIFTRRLAALRDVEVVAMEIDWACYERLRHNLAGKDHVRCYHADSRHFDPEGTFDAILSSFADHHIKPTDKALYFDNVRRNLTPNGVFIVGDEFLRAHDPNNEVDRRAALEAYHQHIIAIADQERHPILAKLERLALQSGIERWGDFKQTCADYEDLTAKAGFLHRKIKIGPKSAETIGGVYVYEMTQRN